MEFRGRWQFLWESQWRRPTGLAMAVVGVSAIALSLYDLAVAQIGKEPDTWPRARDVLVWLPWYWWIIGALIVASSLLFEGGYRASRRRDQQIRELKDQLRYKRFLDSQAKLLEDKGPSITIPPNGGRTLYGSITSFFGEYTGVEAAKIYGHRLPPKKTTCAGKTIIEANVAITIEILFKHMEPAHFQTPFLQVEDGERIQPAYDQWDGKAYNVTFVMPAWSAGSGKNVRATFPGDTTTVATAVIYVL